MENDRNINWFSSKVSRQLIFDAEIKIFQDKINTFQEGEIKLRLEAAGRKNKFDLLDISKHHFVDLMDLEVLNFLELVPEGGVVLDIGGGWGWHWRNLHIARPDVKIIIFDLLPENLMHVKDFCVTQNNNIVLVNGDACNLPFNSESIDAIWTVQTFQHIQDFSQAVNESYRVLKHGGLFRNYSVNKNCLTGILNILLLRKYHVHGFKKNLFWLSLASKGQRDIIANIFNCGVEYYFNEHFFHPNFKLTISPTSEKRIARIDLICSRIRVIGRFIARQQVYNVKKINI